MNRPPRLRWAPSLRPGPHRPTGGYRLSNGDSALACASGRRRRGANKHAIRAEAPAALATEQAQVARASLAPLRVLRSPGFDPRVVVDVKRRVFRPACASGVPAIDETRSRPRWPKCAHSSTDTLAKPVRLKITGPPRVRERPSARRASSLTKAAARGADLRTNRSATAALVAVSCASSPSSMATLRPPIARADRTQA